MCYRIWQLSGIEKLIPMFVVTSLFTSMHSSSIIWCILWRIALHYYVVVVVVSLMFLY